MFAPGITLCVLVLLALGLGVADPADAQLINPAYDLGPAGPVGNFGLAVGPPFQDGFWGAEASSIVNVTTCGTPARSAQYMLEMSPAGGSHSQAWQMVDVTGNPPGAVTVSMWATSCAISGAPNVGVEIRTYNSINGWPNHTSLTNANLNLDLDADTWQQVSIPCALIPPDTEWIMVHLYLVNATAAGVPAYIDDVTLGLDACPTPVEPTTWGNIKSLYQAESR